MDRVHLAWDMAGQANDDGTRSLRSALDSTRLGMSESTVKRHRRWLEEQGWLSIRIKGGNGRGANVYDLSVPPAWVGLEAQADQHLAKVEQLRERVPFVRANT